MQTASSTPFSDCGWTPSLKPNHRAVKRWKPTCATHTQLLAPGPCWVSMDICSLWGTRPPSWGQLPVHQWVPWHRGGTITGRNEVTTPSWPACKFKRMLATTALTSSVRLTNPVARLSMKSFMQSPLEKPQGVSHWPWGYTRVTSPSSPASLSGKSPVLPAEQPYRVRQAQNPLSISMEDW